jgi:hypothetical protein
MNGGTVDTTGHVTFIKLVPARGGWDFCLFGLLPDGSSNPDVFAVWWGTKLLPQQMPTAADWIMRNMQLGMLREAMDQKFQVTVTHDPTSNTFTALQVNGQ